MANLDDLLEKTSRTFALTIPLLPEPARRQVAVAYLLFRIADTFEDAELWPPHRRKSALEGFSELLRSPDSAAVEPLAREWAREPPVAHAGYRELLSEAPSVLRDFAALDAPARELVCSHVRRSAEGMGSFVARMSPEGDLVLEDLPDLRRYCYAVAGIVGEMLTELFLLGGRLAPAAPLMKQNASLFGEGLQLVNILKDSSADSRSGRRYVPDRVNRAEVFALARGDLARAGEYVLALQKSGAPRGFIAFTALPAELAWASLDKIEKLGAGAKISRPEVFFIAKRLERALDRDEPAIFSIS
jgi:farnesyl-diphosphate farnesyltransferase